MQSLKYRGVLLLLCSLMILSFQNCSKIGNNAVVFEGESLGLSDELLIPGGDPVSVSEPAPNPADGKDKTPEMPVTSESEIAEVVALCRDAEKASGFRDSQVIQAVQESLDSIVNLVSSLNSVHSRLVLRAAGAQSTVGDAQGVHSDLVLCGFSKISSIRATQSRIFVVGGSVGSAHLVHSSMILINAQVKDHGGVQSVIRTYSLQ
ncbi:hypothetical protein [Bdellovibrio sp.]|uniref:hypothetical protein n=1 Tax=Bdellovibrio TaxID=958 RepID=UPI003221CD74